MAGQMERVSNLVYRIYGGLKQEYGLSFSSRMGRVEGGSFTLQPSQIPTGYSRIMGLLFHQPTGGHDSNAKIT